MGKEVFIRTLFLNEFVEETNKNLGRNISAYLKNAVFSITVELVCKL